MSVRMYLLSVRMYLLRHVGNSILRERNDFRQILLCNGRLLLWLIKNVVICFQKTRLRGSQEAQSMHILLMHNLTYTVGSSLADDSKTRH